VPLLYSASSANSAASPDHVPLAEARPSNASASLGTRPSPNSFAFQIAQQHAAWFSTPLEYPYSFTYAADSYRAIGWGSTSNVRVADHDRRGPDTNASRSPTSMGRLTSRRVPRAVAHHFALPPAGFSSSACRPNASLCVTLIFWGAGREQLADSPGANLVSAWTLLEFLSSDVWDYREAPRARDGS